MPAGWGRDKPRLEPSFPEVADLLAETGIVPLSFLPIAEGNANTNLRVETGDGPVHLRLLQRDPRQQTKEARLAKRLQGLVSAPALLAQGEDFLVYEWQEGVMLERAMLTGRELPYARIADQLAEVRLALDTLTYPEPGRLDDQLVVKTSWSSVVQEYFGYVRLMVEFPARDLDYAIRVERTVDAAQTRLMALQGSPALTHGDYSPSNFLVDETGLVAVLDWEAAHAGSRLVDVGHLLRFPHRLPANFAQTFLGRLELDEDAALLARVLDLTYLVDMHMSAPRDSRRQRKLRKRILHVCNLF